jgi:hypothetical protein
MKADWIALAMLAAAPIAMGSTISIHASGLITNEWKSGSGFPTVDVGDGFVLSVTYTDSLPDQSGGFNPGQILPDDLTVSLQILGQGTIFSATGGVVSRVTQCTTGPGGSCYPAIRIFSSSGGVGFELLFADRDLSLPPIDSIWIDYGQIYEYESVGFYLQPPFPESGRLTGTASSVVVPEPSGLALAGLGLALSAFIRQRPRQTRVEQAAPEQPLPAALFR